MMMLLSGAWWAQRLTGVAAQAFAISVGAAVVISMIVGGLSWLRADARADERASWEMRTAHARAAAEADARGRMEASERIAAAEAEKWLRDFTATEAARVELERLLTAKQAKTVCFPSSMVEALNR